MRPRQLIFVLGVPGSGKTTLARALVPRLAATYVCSDTISDVLCGSDRTSDNYLRLRPKIYDVIYELVRANLGLGNSVVLDAPHVRPMANPEWRAKISKLAVDTSAALKLIRMYCAEDLLRRRIQERGSGRDVDKLRDWGAFLSEQPIHFPIPLDHLDVDSGQEVSLQLDAVLRYLSIKQARS